MNISTQLHKRLEQLGWTLYKLAKQFSEIRSIDGIVSPAVRYHTAVGRAIENPSKSKLETIEGIVKALGGELKIEWNTPGMENNQVKNWSPSLANYQIRFWLHDSLVKCNLLRHLHGGSERSS